MTRTKKLLLFCAVFLLAVLAGCSEKQGLSTEFDMGSLYSTDEQRFCIDKLAVPLGADELVDTLKEYGLKYTEEAYNDAVTQWVVTAPVSIEGYEASLMFRMRTDGASQTCDQITLCITEGDIREIYEDLVAAATEAFGEPAVAADAGGEPGNEVVMQQAWRAYTGYGIYGGGQSMPEGGDASSLNIVLDQSYAQVYVFICE